MVVGCEWRQGGGKKLERDKKKLRGLERRERELWFLRDREKSVKRENSVAVDWESTT